MDDKSDEADSTSWKSLLRIPDSVLRHSNREDVGRVYSDVLLDLQIRPEHHAAFFEGNIRPFRNKKGNTVLLAKGDDISRLKLSTTYVTAYGSIVWGTDRRWLLRFDEIDNGRQPLKYLPPKARQDGDHDRFYQILEKLWKRMRDIIFELRPKVQKSNGIGKFDVMQNPRQREAATFTPPTTPVLFARQGANQGVFVQSGETYPIAQVDRVSSQPANRSIGRFDNNLPTRNDTTSEEDWPTGKTEQMIINGLDSLVQAQQESHPEVFKTLWHRHLARLEEIEQFSEQEISRMAQKAAVKTSGEVNIETNQTSPNEETDGVEDKSTESPTIAKPESSEEQDIIMTDNTDVNQPAAFSSPTANMLPRQPSTTNNATHPDQMISHSDQYRPSIQPPFSLTAYIPPTIPNRMTVYITPYIHTAMHFSQPWIWPDAPVHPTSYIAFRNGIRLRANVPDSVPDEKMSMVFAYGWDDFCCVVTGEDSWRDWFIKDLVFAGKRGGVGVWRMRVCVVDAGIGCGS